MAVYKRGQMVQHRGSGYIADAQTSGEPGVDPAWRLLARGIPAPVFDGQVLTVVAGEPAWAAPQGGGDGGGGEPGAGATLLAVAHPDTTGTGGWARSDDYPWGDLTSDGEVLRLVSNQPQQFVRWYADAWRLPAPLGLGVVDLSFDMLLESEGLGGASAGVVLTDRGDRGQLAFRIDDLGGGAVGCRFEYDGVAGIVTRDSAGSFGLDAWHRIRVVRRGPSAAAFIDDSFVLGTDGGPADTPTAITLLMYGGNSAGAAARFGNLFAITSFVSTPSYQGPLPTPPAGGGGPTDPPEDDDVPKQITRPTPFSALVSAITDEQGVDVMRVTFTVQLNAQYTDNTAAQVDHVDLWRVTYSGGQPEAVRVKSVQPRDGSTFFWDEATTPGTYDYFVRAVDQYGIEGVPSYNVEVNMVDGSSGNDTPQPE